MWEVYNTIWFKLVFYLFFIQVKYLYKNLYLYKFKLV